MPSNANSKLSSVNAIVERSSFAYRSKIGFVVAGHQSMCFSHANRLHFRLRCLTCGVQRSYLFHTEVFDSLISRVTCPSTSLWGKPWGFGAPIALSACSVLFQMLPFSYWTYKPMSSFGLTKQLPVFRFPGSSEKLEMRGIALRTSRLLSERSTIWATSPLRKRGANANFNLPSVNALLERSSFAYRSKNGFVVAGHQSMCFSHANRLHFRLRCLTCGVQRSYLFHTAVFDSLISRVTCPSTSLWGKPCGFGAPIAFSACSVLFQMLPFSYWTYKPMSSFGLTKQLPVFRFPGSSEKLEMRGFDLRTSRMLSERSTIWATSPLRKRGANAISNLSSVNAIVERSSFAYRSKNGFVDAGHQSMCFSHANRLPFQLTCLAGGVQRSYLFHTEVFDSLFSRAMFPSTSSWGTPWRMAELIAFSASSVLFQMLHSANSTYVWMSFFDLTN